MLHFTTHWNVMSTHLLMKHIVKLNNHGVLYDDSAPHVCQSGVSVGGVRGVAQVCLFLADVPVQTLR